MTSRFDTDTPPVYRFPDAELDRLYLGDDAIYYKDSPSRLSADNPTDPNLVSRTMSFEWVFGGSLYTVTASNVDVSPTVTISIISSLLITSAAHFSSVTASATCVAVDAGNHRGTYVADISFTSHPNTPLSLIHI